MYTVLGSLYKSVFKAVHPYSFSIVYSIIFNNIDISMKEGVSLLKMPVSPATLTFVYSVVYSAV